MVQKFTSASTCLNQVPAGHKLIKLIDGYGRYNIDIGGGKFQTYTSALEKEEVINKVYDPMNRPPEDNNAVMLFAKEIGGYDTATCHNVLNVIDCPISRNSVIKLAYDLVKYSGVAYFTTYEGDGSGVGSQSKRDCWQNNLKTIKYVAEIKEVFPSVSRKGKLIVAEKIRSG